MGNLHRLRRPARGELIHAAVAAAATSLLFVAVYGGCSWLTSLRSDVGTWVFNWEKAMPFVPAMIIPYMSIDLFFVGAPFVCTDRAERRLYAKRITFAILVAGAFFLLMPLQFAFPRPVPEGWTGPIFSFLHGFDRPYNMFPSLHIALRTILADTYARHTRGALRWVVHVWFSLIGFSTVLTWQHHVADVAGGFVLALFCFYLIREPAARTRSVNYRVGFYYICGAGILFLAALLLKGWWLLLLWPAVAFGLTGGAYFGLVPGVFRKEEGLLPLSTRCLMAPVLLGHRLSLRYYQRRAEPWNEILPDLWMGRRLDEKEAQQALRLGITAVLDLTSEFSEPPAFRSIRYLNLPILDLTAPDPSQLEAAVEFIDRERQKGIVYVHCKIGYSRSAAAVGTYLCATGIAGTADDAIAIMRLARPSLIVRAEARRAMLSAKDLPGVFAGPLSCEPETSLPPSGKATGQREIVGTEETPAWLNCRH
jgi:protein-tyrosine phosphatase/membrane-associated phospholipid phosphatase